MDLNLPFSLGIKYKLFTPAQLFSASGTSTSEYALKVALYNVYANFLHRLYLPFPPGSNRTERSKGGRKRSVKTIHIDGIKYLRLTLG